MNDRELGVLLLDPQTYVDAEIMGLDGEKLLESFVRNTLKCMSHTRKKREENLANQINTKTRMNNFKSPVKLH